MSGFFNNEENVKNYMVMSAGNYDDFLVGLLDRFMGDGKTVLELGSGPGNDFGHLTKGYEATASDMSKVFLRILKERYPVDQVVELDATTLEIDAKFDAVYSNKVLQHLTKQSLAESLQKQVEILEDNGIVLHSFWYGDTEEMYDGLRFVYYTETQLKEVFEVTYEILEMKRYKEVEQDDSIYVVAKVKQRTDSL